MNKSSLIGCDATLQQVKDLIAAIRPARWRADFPTSTDLEEVFQSPGIAQNARLWRGTAGEAAAYAFVHFPYNNLTFEIHREYRDDGLEDEILAWAVERMRARYGSSLADNSLDGSCRVDDARMVGFFTRHGFDKEEVESVMYEVELAAPPSAAVLPAGFTIRPLNAGSELAEVLAVHQAAYGSRDFTLEDRLAMMNTAAYIPALDLVAVAPGGALAGNCVCGVEGVSALDGVLEGYTDPVVVGPAFQRMGLAAALLLSGLAGLHAQGVRRARLGTSSTNRGMKRAAEAAGFHLVAQKAWFSLKLSG